MSDRSLRTTDLAFLHVEPATWAEDGSRAVVVWAEDRATGRTIRLAFDPRDAAELATRIAETVIGIVEDDDGIEGA